MKPTYAVGGWVVFSTACVLSTMSQEERSSEDTKVQERQYPPGLFNPLIAGGYALLGGMALYAMNKRGYFDELKHGWTEARSGIVHGFRDRMAVALETINDMFKSRKESDGPGVPSFSEDGYQSLPPQQQQQQQQQQQPEPVFQRFSRALKSFRSVAEGSQLERGKLLRMAEDGIVEFLQRFHSKLEERRVQRRLK